MKPAKVHIDTTLMKILGITMICFLIGITLFHNIGMHESQSLEQQFLIKEQQTLESQIHTLKTVFNEPTFTQIGNANTLSHQSYSQNRQNKQKSEVHIQKPIIDKKTYKYLKLDNDLKVVIIQDPEAKMTSAALNVNVGSWSEPNEFPGLAHFLEHMLFQGSETYPKTSYFEQMIAKGGGYTNAYTEGMRTNYYFTIESSKSYEALDVFAHFFIDPLLSKDMVEKEANAVNSEYEINVNGDGWKLMFLLGLISDSSHPFSRFTIGNLDSLVKPDVVDALKKFHQDYYSSNQMALVIRSNIDVEEMFDFINTSEFTKIPNKKLSKPSMLHYGMPIQNLGQLIKYHLNTKSTEIVYVYQLEDAKAHYLTKPLDFIDSIVQSRHKGGLYDYLISHNLAIDMNSTPFLGGNGGFMFYIIEVELDQDDGNSHKDQAIVIGQAIITYFDQLLNEFFDEEMEPTETLKDTYENKKNMENVQFKYMEKDIDIFKLSHNLNTYPPKYVLNAELIFKEYKPKVIFNYLAELINPENMIIMVGDDHYKLAKNEEENLSFLSYIAPEEMVFLQTSNDDEKFLDDNDVTQSSSLYKLEYEQKSLGQESLQIMAEQGLKLTLPQINHYIPKSLSFKSLCNSKQTISYIQSVDSKNIYGDRQNIFLESKHKLPFYFTSKKECKKHEFEYEGYNHFPMLIQKNLEGKTWWRLDRAYSPTVYAGLTFDTPIDMTSLNRVALVKVFNQYVATSLQQKLQPSFEAGYKLSFDSTIRGISLELFGWSDKFDYFYNNVLKEIRNDCNKEDQLNRIKSNLISELQNAYEDRLYIQAITNFLPFILQNNPSPQQMIEEIRAIDVEQVQDFQKEILKSFRFTSYFTGNILRDEVHILTQQIHQIFDESIAEASLSNHQTIVADISKKSLQYVVISKSSNEQDTNGVTLNYYQIGSRNQKSYSLMNLLSKSIQNAAYSYLRTQLQLGYVVNVKFRPSGCIDAAQILVQGTAQPPYIVNEKIEEFLIQYGQQLEEMTDEQFEDLKRTNIAQLTDQDKNLQDKAQNTWSHIKFNDLAFEEKEVAASLMEQLKKEELIEFYNKVFRGGKLSLQIYGKGMIKDTLKMNEDEFMNTVNSKTLNSEQTFAKRKEQSVQSQDEFRQKINKNYNCSYRISNI